MAFNDVDTLSDSTQKKVLKEENECPLNELSMTTRWKREKKNFHWTRMCLSFRLGPIDVNWKQSLFDEARESLFVFFPLLGNKQKNIFHSKRPHDEADCAFR